MTKRYASTHKRCQEIISQLEKLIPPKDWEFIQSRLDSVRFHRIWANEGNENCPAVVLPEGEKYIIRLFLENLRYERRKSLIGIIAHEFAHVFEGLDTNISDYELEKAAQDRVRAWGIETIPRHIATGEIEIRPDGTQVIIYDVV